MRYSIAYWSVLYRTEIYFFLARIHVKGSVSADLSEALYFHGVHVQKAHLIVLDRLALL